MRAVEAIQRIEAALGKPVVSSNQVGARTCDRHPCASSAPRSTPHTTHHYASSAPRPTLPAPLCVLRLRLTKPCVLLAGHDVLHHACAGPTLPLGLAGEAI